MTALVSGSMSRCICACSAALFVAVSASQNISHGYALGAARSEAAALIFASGSLAGALMQPCAFLAALTSFRNWAFGKGIVALALGLACSSYATISSLGFVSTSRDTATAARAADADAYSNAKLKVETANLELKSLAAAAPANRKTEAERAKRRAELEKSRSDAEKVMGAGHTAGVADPTAAAIAAYAGALGWLVKPEMLPPWLALLSVIFFELGAASSLIVLAALQPPQGLRSHGAADNAVMDVPTAPAPAMEPGETVSEVMQGKQRGRKRSAPLEKVMTRLHEAGGSIEGPLETIGERLGIPTKSSTHRTLNALAGAGLVTLISSAAGTLVQAR